MGGDHFRMLLHPSRKDMIVAWTRLVMEMELSEHIEEILRWASAMKRNG